MATPTHGPSSGATPPKNRGSERSDGDGHCRRYSTCAAELAAVGRVAAALHPCPARP
jgi:hypothetical protein